MSDNAYKRLMTPKLALALHQVYLSLYEARKACSDEITDNDLTRVLTSLMASRPWSWMVVGITPAALEIFAQNDFHRPARQLQRGHLVDRVQTTRTLFRREQPATRDEFYGIWMRNDRTVLMLNNENNHGRKIPDYIPIQNEGALLFPSGSLIGWQHRKAERDFLRQLHESRAQTR
jgi:hypothetical protein